MTAPTDARGTILSPGTFVVFATNDRYSGLQFGTVHKIRDTKGWTTLWNDDKQDWERVEQTNFKIQFLKTDAFGAPVFDTVYDPEAPNPHRQGRKGAHVTTDKQSKSGYVEIHGGKVLAL